MNIKPKFLLNQAIFPLIRLIYLDEMSLVTVISNKYYSGIDSIIVVFTFLRLSKYENIIHFFLVAL